MKRERERGEGGGQRESSIYSNGEKVRKETNAYRVFTIKGVGCLY